MKSKRIAILGSITFSAACLAFPAFVGAQAPPGPIQGQPPQPASLSAKPQQPVPEVKPRTTIFGAWKLNRDESDDARKKMQDARRTSQGSGGPRMGGPFPGNGPYGRRRGGMGGENDGDRQGMQEILSPSRSLNIAEAKKEVEVDVFDDQQRKSAFFTDGRKVQKPKDPNNQQIAAHWDGNRLITDEKSSRGGKMSRTYELSDDGLQLWETLRVPAGRSSTPMNIRYVYDQANRTQTSQTTK
jgi:hypothetical protein